MTDFRRSWFARAVRLLPGSFDNDDRSALVEMFDARAAGARDRNAAARVWFIVREAVGLIGLIMLAHFTLHRRMRLADHARREIRHATRRLRRTPLLSASAVAMMALSIGGATVAFALLNRIVLSPLPYFESDRLIYLDHDAPAAGVTSLGLSIGLFQQYQTLPSLESAALYYSGVQTMTGRGDAAQLPFLHTTPSLGAVLRLPVAQGRWFTEAEGQIGAADVVVLTDTLWRGRFNADAAVLGSIVQLDGRPHAVVGVLGRDAALPHAAAEFVLPLRLPPNYRRAAGFNYEGIARLAAGVSLEIARRQQDAVIAEIPNRFAGDPELSQGLLAEFRIRSTAKLLKDHVLGTAPRTLWLIFAATAIVLAIAAANLATLFVVRADGRRAEAALRRALGAHPLVDAIGAAAEPALVCATGAALGLLIAGAGLRALRNGGGLDLPLQADTRLTVLIAGLAMATAIVIGVAAGLAGWRRGSRDLVPMLDAGTRLAGNSLGRGRLRQLVTGVQVALATLLLIAASLLIQSARHLRQTDPGFHAANTLTFRVALPRGSYRTRASAEAFHQRLLEAVDGVPGTSLASLTTTLPLDGEGIGNPVEISGRPTAVVNALGIVRLRRVSDGYFRAMKIPVRRGRTFEPSDATNVLQAAVINEAMAARYFGGDDPIGRQLRPANASDVDGWLTIVGLVGNNVTYGLYEPVPIPQLFVPLLGPVRTDVPAVFTATYVVNTSIDPMLAVNDVRRAVASIDPSVAVARPEALSSLVERAQARVRTSAAILALTAVTAVVLGLIGVYAVVAHTVTERSAEISVRMAFGADAGRVVLAVAGRSGFAILGGCALGVVAAAGLSTALTTMVVGISATDALTYGLSATAVITLCLLACWVPARRVARLDPASVLRR